MSWLEREIEYRAVEISGALFYFSFVRILLEKIEMDQTDDVGKKKQNCQRNVLEWVGETGKEWPSEQVDLSHQQAILYQRKGHVYGIEASRWVGIGKVVEVLDNFYFL